MIEKPFSQFHAWLQAMPKTTVASGMFLLAARKRDEQLMSAIAVYLSRDFGANAFGHWMFEEATALLTEDELSWVWGVVDNAIEEKSKG